MKSLISVFVIAVLNATPVWAEKGATASTSSDTQVAKDYPLTIGHGNVDVEDHRLEFGVGYMRDSAGDQGANAKLEASKKYTLGRYKVDYTTSVAPLLIEPRVRAEANGTKAYGIKKIEAEAGLVSILYVNFLGEDHSYDNRKAINIRTDDVDATADLTLASAGIRYHKDLDLAIKQYGGWLKFAEMSAHYAFRVNGVNVDICGQVIPFALLVGGVSTEYKSRYEGLLKACVGVRLGKLGHLTGEFSATSDFQDYFKVSAQTSLKDIGGTSLGISHTYEHEETKDGLKINRNIAGVQAAF